MSGLFTVVGSVLALLAFGMLTAWILTPKRQPARRSRRGWGGIFLLAAAATAMYLSSLFSSE
ncbi:hypothetical protein [Leucobacter sp. G161]|uniref:hypothetical protein n=1 Tax=Leucobacter sp. G161 TaxID=663704 RepID=UPI00073B40E6|nr:hypothetical protein [Leucobacter sp. G161]KUF06678.1 hypothetical protein AUL38_11670 [Leucobacter sp. G161]